ncbi:GDSL-type esterase/lipase family protein [Albibacterium indicum]|uniref:GDSL-type esterase/lipase family protein n=1 Tax=Albibacterium indicum TaxID=2292082 RepID=UPI000E528CFF|nr:GDSL-type esterase/lipase family protein [Pedobacter indicus]
MKINRPKPKSKKLLFTLFFALLYSNFNLISIFAQEKQIVETSSITEPARIPNHLHDSLFSTYYQQRVSHFRSLPIHPNSIVFLGNSITDGAEWSELFANSSIINRGISGDKTAGILNRLDEITNRKPLKVFLLIGTNDLEHKIPQQEVIDNIFLIARILKQDSPDTKLYIQSILPVNDFYKKFNNHTKNGKAIEQINTVLSENAVKYSYKFIDLHRSFIDAEGKLKKDLTNDGLHLNGKAYQEWKELILPFVLEE